jgi:hypothetical protein
MQGHFKHLHFKTFLMVSSRPNLVLVFLSNQGSKHLQLPHECNSHSRGALGSHSASSLALSPICENVFHTKTHYWLHGLVHFTINRKPNVRVVIETMTLVELVVTI